MATGNEPVQPPVSPEGDSTNWRPIFILAPKEYLDQRIASKNLTAESLNEYSDIARERAKYFLEQTIFIFEPEPENTSLAEFADNPIYQAAVLSCMSWRTSTIVEALNAKLINRGLEGNLDPYRTNINDLLARDDIIEIFPELLEFTVIQCRREDFFQKFFVVFGQYEIAQLDNDMKKFDAEFQTSCFTSPKSFRDFVNSIRPIVTNISLLQQIKQHFFENNSVSDNIVQSSLSQFLYVLKTHPQAEDLTFRSIAQYIVSEGRTSDLPAEIIKTILNRLGIPYNEEITDLIGQENPNLMPLAQYIGQHFSAPNSTHYRD